MDPNVGGVLRASARASVIHPDVSHKKEGALAADEPVPLSKTYSEIPGHIFVALMVSSLCNNSSVVFDEESKSWTGVGDPTEVALVVAAAKSGFPKEWFADKGFAKIGEQAFDSDRKLMSVVYAAPAAGRATVLVKGAPEEVLARCTHYVPPSAEGAQEPLDLAFAAKAGCAPIPLNDEFAELVSTQSRRMAVGGLRVLGLAIKCVQPKEPTAVPAAVAASEATDGSHPDYAENDLAFVGLVGLIDPPRPGVKESVAKCKAAGVKVIMITGDHVATATAIATELGIFEPGCRTIKGSELDLLSDEAMAELKPFPNVPDNKLKIVQALQMKGNLAAMTGDGVNGTFLRVFFAAVARLPPPNPDPLSEPVSDAPAIKKADIGIAMGQTGTEITKQAADIVLANDDFNTIVFAIEEGRRVYDNILKFCVYLLSCNFAEIQLFLLTTFLNVEMPFTTMMILWANII
ncbi:MAG: P-type ATPase, partial [Olpidium bornovanus]